MFNKYVMSVVVVILLAGAVVLWAMPVPDTPTSTQESLPTVSSTPAILALDGEFSAVYDQAYGDHEKQRLDVYYTTDQVDRPAVVMIHGGGWKGGDKQTFERYAELFGEQNIVFVSTNYRLTNEGAIPHPAQVQDVACALLYTKVTARDYGIDPDRIFVMGHSAGAHLGAMLAYQSENPSWQEGCDYANRGFDTRVAGFIGTSGVYDFDLLPQGRHKDVEALVGVTSSPGWDVAEPINFVDVNDPPALLIHGDEDDFVNFHNSIAFADQLEQADVMVTLTLVEGLHHNDPKREFLINQTLQQQVFDFIATH